MRLLAKVLVELYRGDRRSGGCVVPAMRAPLVADLCASLHDGSRPLRWVGDPRVREQAYALAMGPRPAAARVTAPETLCAELRPYQREGVAWLQNLAE